MTDKTVRTDGQAAHRTIAKRRHPGSDLAFVVVASCACVIAGLTFWGTRTPDLFPDFQMFPSARTFDPPGSVFRINHDGVRYDVADVSHDVSVNQGSEQLPDQDGRRHVDGALLAGLVGGRGTAGVSASGAYDVKLRISGALREMTSDSTLDKVLASALKGVTLRLDNRYFVIRETIAVREVDYELATADLASVAGQAGNDLVGSGNLKIRQEGAGRSVLAGKYDTPYRLFYKVEEVTFDASGLNGNVSVSRQPVRKPLAWRDASSIH